jgi:ATP-dependent protease ClpP protease subunit
VIRGVLVYSVNGQHSLKLLDRFWKAGPGNFQQAPKDIKSGDFATFSNAADKIKRTLIQKYPSNLRDTIPSIIVELDTPGGDVMEAVKIRRLIRERFMITVVKPERECSSACVFILMAGVIRDPIDLAHVGLHRPKFDATYFASLTPEEARVKYNTLVEALRKYFIDDMGGNEQAFRLMMSTPSYDVRFLSFAEMQEFGLLGNDPVWDEYNEAQEVKQYGTKRWPLIKRCIGPSGDFAGCVKKVYELYPDK